MSEEKTQGDLLREYLALETAKPNEEELALRNEADSKKPYLLPRELAARIGVEKSMVVAWLNDEQPLMYEMNGHEIVREFSIGPVKAALGLNDDQNFDLNPARKRLARELSASPSTQQEAPVASAANGEVGEDEGKALRVAAGSALRELMAVTPKSEKEMKARKSHDGGDKGHVMDRVLPVELVHRKGMKITASALRAMTGDSQRAPHARITPQTVDMLVDVMSQSVPEGDREFAAAERKFRAAVEASQSAWDQYEEQQEARHAAAQAARDERRAAAKKAR